jgi:hypothetical protein
MLVCAFVVIELFWSSDSSVGSVTVLFRAWESIESRISKATSLFHLTALWKRICSTNLNLLKWNLNGQALSGFLFLMHLTSLSWPKKLYGMVCKLLWVHSKDKTRKSLCLSYFGHPPISMPRSSIRVFSLAIWAPYINTLSRYSLQPIHFLKHQRLATVKSCQEVQHVVKGLFTSFASALIEHRCCRRKK